MSLYNNEQTPLQNALRRKDEKSCSNCEKLVKVDNAFYCGVSEKLLMPRYMGQQCCAGKYLKGDKQ